ncbi:N-acetyltransferase [Gordonia sp. HNM0687]|uniref:N-acetyltransferase n=1 Tax=Gordonia mangrovi TaxID=2665643 RepID=A0A6L7GP80_9ACTN|nr:GNAT family N-acetyltransferase [Gordonia mangrovi]MDY6807952.1 GNAT family N-acetyltransferase [Actinomycetota bacterium]MXP20495.1 N-acetyltransferase [Gordonia mangrovi]UVF78911.1 N-acetyltransferase [Gordonia mangrovi]
MTTDKTGAAVTVTHQPTAQRFEIAVDDATSSGPVTAGFTAYRERDADDTRQRVFFHTEVAEEFGGRGLGTILIRRALDETRADGFVIVGVCPMVAAFLRKHPEYADAARRPTPDLLRWLDGELS